jgi:hypothetical protein
MSIADALDWIWLICGATAAVAAVLLALYALAALVHRLLHAVEDRPAIEGPRLQRGPKEKEWSE